MNIGLRAVYAGSTCQHRENNHGVRRQLSQDAVERIRSMPNTLSVRRLWTTYKKLALVRRVGHSDLEILLMNTAFYAGARGVLKVLAELLEHGDLEELHRIVRHQGRQIARIENRPEPPRPRRQRRRPH
jgi:hypothetical protein